MSPSQKEEEANKKIARKMAAYARRKALTWEKSFWSLKVIVHLFSMSVLSEAAFMLIKIVQLSPLTDERMRRNEEKLEEKIRPPDSITKVALKWSKGRPERGELYHLNERKNLLKICQHVELVNYPFKVNKTKLCVE